MAFRIFLHAMKMLTGNLPTALRIGWPLAVALVALNFYMGADTYVTPDFEARPDLMGPYFSKLGVVLLVQSVVLFWIVVAWHRFILLEEEPTGPLAMPNAPAMGRYAMGSLISFLVIPAAIVGGIIGGVLFLILGATQSSAAAVLPGLAGGLIAYVIFLRISPMLPSAAVGPRMGWRAAWDATKGATGTFFLLGLISLVLAFGLNLIPQTLAPTALPVALLIGGLIQAVATMLGASILTTIYGVYVEKRSLNA